MEGGNGELGDVAQVRVKTAVVGREHDLGSDGGQLGVGSSVVLLEVLGRVNHEDGLIDLNPSAPAALRSVKRRS